MEYPKVSVIIPTYNRFEFLLYAIESVYNQKYPNFEIIVVNDCSTDKKYREYKFPKEIKKVDLVINQKKVIGYISDGHIRNFGLEIASGKYIATLDDDDFWLPNKLFMQIESLENSINKMSCTEGYIGEGKFTLEKKYQLYNSERFLKKISKKHKKSLLKSLTNFEFPNEFDFNFIKIHNSIIASSVVVERELLNFLGGFRPIPSSNDYAPDYDCWLGLLRLTNCNYIKEPLIYYDELHGYGREWED